MKKKKKEKKRDEVLKKLITSKEKRKMEKVFGKERANATIKLRTKNNEIQEKIKNYELKLRKQSKKNI